MNKLVIPLLLVVLFGALSLYGFFKSLGASPQSNTVANFKLESLLTSLKLPKPNNQIGRVNQKLGSYQLKFATTSAVDQTVIIEGQDSSLSITPLDSQTLGPINLQNLKHEANKLIYQNIYNGINLIYTLTKDQILEEYEIKTKRQGLTEIVQKMDITGLAYEKQSDGSITFYKQGLFNKTGSTPLFSIPKPVMYEKYNASARSYGLHYEIITTNNRTFLVKVIDQTGQDWLNQAAYPVMIDGTVVTTQLILQPEPIVGSDWKIRLDTVGAANLSFAISPIAIFKSLTCGQATIQINNNTVPNFSCPEAAFLTFTLPSPDTYQLEVTFGPDRQTSSITYQPADSQPVFLSTGQNPIIVRPGDTITVNAHVADPNGITSVTAKLGKTLPTIDLHLSSGTASDGTWTGTWVAIGTGPIEYQTIITAINSLGRSTQSEPIIWSDWDCLTGGDHGGGGFTPVSDCTNGIIAGNHFAISTFSVGTGTTASVQAHDLANYGTVDIAATTVNIEGLLTAVGKGYPGATVSHVNGYGPGGGEGLNADIVAASGSHGGLGINGWNNTKAGPIYGSFTQPVTMGSGGGGGNWYGFNNGGAGGGAIKLAASGTLTVSGTVSANGAAPANNIDASAGSGGSVYLVAGTLEGTGTVSAIGGPGAQWSAPGGGGRIAVTYSVNNTSNLTINAGGNTGHAGPSQAGSAIIEDTTNDDLVIFSAGTLTDADRTSWVFRNLTINGNLTLKPSTANLFTITSTGTTTFGASVTSITIQSTYTNEQTDGRGVAFDLTGDVTIPAGLTINANAQGYPVNYGPGKGLLCGSWCGGSGGGYGGAGGKSTTGSNPDGGSPYGSATSPLDLGSGGGFGSNGEAGKGGGAFKITTTGTLTINGTITANGEAITSSYSGGGGSGGSIWISAGTLAGSGTISAKGGTSSCGGFCGTAGGGGGGGRIAVYYQTANNWAGTALTEAGSATAGAGSGGGSNGSVTLINGAPDPTSTPTPTNTPTPTVTPTPTSAPSAAGFQSNNIMLEGLQVR